MNDPALKIVPGKTDAEKAVEFKGRIVEALKPVMAIIDEAQREELNINYQIATDALGKATIVQLNITKTFK